MKIVRLMATPPVQHDLNWLKDSLQAAIELELATIPPYLCALWSIKDENHPAHSAIGSIVLQEMLHLGLACNLLTTIGGDPRLNAADSVPTYPGPLPGGVRPGLRVALSGLTKDVVERVFMQIEYPEAGPIAFVRGETYPTIGGFYDAILAAFFKQPASVVTGARQLTSGGVGLFKINTSDDVKKAILEIKQQGEGTSQSPEAVDFGGDLAHYYRFAEIWHERRLIKNAAGQWKYEGQPLPFPDVYPMAEVPAGGYPESLEFDKQFTTVLDRLQAAWQNGDQAQLSKAVGAMFDLGDLALDLIKRPLPSGQGNYGPDFRLIPHAAAEAGTWGRLPNLPRGVRSAGFSPYVPPARAEARTTNASAAGSDTAAAPAILPQQIINLMAQRDHRLHHYLWHEVRNGWLFYDEPTRNAIRALGWEPPRPALRPSPGGGRTPMLDNGSGEDFLYMHRQMIALVNQRLAEIGDPNYPRVQGWPSLPAPGAADYPVPPAWDSGDPGLNSYLQETKSDDFFSTTMRGWESQLADPDWLRQRSLGEVGARIEMTIHNRMHMRWCSNPGAMRPDADPAHPDDIDPQWDVPSYDWLGDTYASHVHPWFWKIHGWVDDHIEAWARANGITGSIPWQGTWVGKMPPHPTPNSLHALLTAGVAAVGEHHDHGSELRQLLRIVQQSGVRTRFYDRIEAPG